MWISYCITLLHSHISWFFTFFPMRRYFVSNNKKLDCVFRSFQDFCQTVKTRRAPCFLVVDLFVEAGVNFTKLWASSAQHAQHVAKNLSFKFTINWNSKFQAKICSKSCSPTKCGRINPWSTKRWTSWIFKLYKLLGLSG